MPPVRECRLQEDLHDLGNLRFAQQIRPQAQHIAMRSLARLSRRHFIMRQRRSNTLNLVGDNRHANAAAIQQNGDIVFPARNRARSRRRVVGIITRHRRLAADVGHLVPGFCQLREQAFLEIREGYVDSGAAPGKDTGWKDPAQLKPETTTKEEVAARKRKRLLGIIPRKSAPAKPASDSDPAKASTVPAPAPTTPPPAGPGIPTQP